MSIPPTPGLRMATMISGLTVVRVLLSVQTFTMAICYILFVALGHGPWFMPMISDLCTRPPEMNIFIIGFIAVATVMACLSFTFRDYVTLQLQLAGIPNDSPLHMKNTALVYLSSVACFFLCVLTSVNEKENDSIHSTAAVIFFILELIYMGLMLAFFANVVDQHGNNVQLMTPASLRNKRIIYGVYIAAIVVLVSMSSNWGKFHNGIAVCEWVAVIAIMFFNGSVSEEIRQVPSYLAFVQVTDAAAVTQGFEPMNAYRV